MCFWYPRLSLSLSFFPLILSFKDKRKKIAQLNNSAFNNSSKAFNVHGLHALTTSSDRLVLINLHPPSSLGTKYRSEVASQNHALPAYKARTSTMNSRCFHTIQSSMPNPRVVILIANLTPVRRVKAGRQQSDRCKGPSSSRSMPIDADRKEDWTTTMEERFWFLVCY